MHRMQCQSLVDRGTKHPHFVHFLHFVQFWKFAIHAAQCLKALKLKVSAPCFYTDKFGAKLKRSSKWHLFFATFSGKIDVYLSTVFVWVTTLHEVKCSTQKYAIWKTRERKKKGAVKFSHCDTKELQLGDISPSKVSLFLSTNEMQGSKKSKKSKCWVALEFIDFNRPCVVPY